MDDREFIFNHAWAYANQEGDPNPSQYANWYVREFGDDIMTCPSHKTTYFTWLWGDWREPPRGGSA